MVQYRKRRRMQEGGTTTEEEQPTNRPIRTDQELFQLLQLWKLQDNGNRCNAILEYHLNYGRYTIWLGI